MTKNISKCYNCNITNPKILTKCVNCGFYMCHAHRTIWQKDYICLDCDRLKLFLPGHKYGVILNNENR